MQKTTNHIREFAIDYTAAWCSHDAVKVASFFSHDGTLRDNDGPMLVGRVAIAESAQGFMTTFPDLMLTLEDVNESHGAIIYKWILEGTHCTTGRSVLLHGSEQWMMGDDGLIAESMGSFDEADYHRQVCEETAPD